MNYFTFLAQEVREYLAEIGFTSLNDIVGRTELIETTNACRNGNMLDFHRLLHKVDNGNALRFANNSSTSNISSTPIPTDLTDVLDRQIIHSAQRAIDSQEEINLDYAIKNTDRAAGVMLSGLIARKYGQTGLPENTVNVKFKGSADRVSEHSSSAV